MQIYSKKKPLRYTVLTKLTIKLVNEKALCFDLLIKLFSTFQLFKLV